MARTSLIWELRRDGGIDPWPQCGHCHDDAIVGTCRVCAQPVRVRHPECGWEDLAGDGKGCSCGRGLEAGPELVEVLPDLRGLDELQLTELHRLVHQEWVRRCPRGQWPEGERALRRMELRSDLRRAKAARATGRHQVADGPGAA